ncbi:putative glutathione-specific gamma-glutamylcyclotransferase 2 [Smittium mucronatum]|uniref:glutathione-specific gamma-glutamylcyclotransferase n=1 Tax=Smittium mucronatum TaxID=133383 RepID=A0A1R0GS53_9FUNG|nr:putative glutathione-specific gamma-glutamylcyclotransferase 2 [Smittium mucronatum]
MFGYIDGYVRRFWQMSHDHRGTEESPGFVVTVIERDVFLKYGDEDIHENEDFKCWGMAYKIKSGCEEEVLKHLDFREKDGYTIHKVKVYSEDFEDPSTKHVLLNDVIVYIGKEDNPSFGGPLDIPTVAQTIASSVGPSGSNYDYLINLVEALRSKSPSSLDKYLVQLNSEVSKIKGKN